MRKILSIAPLFFILSSNLFAETQSQTTIAIDPETVRVGDKVKITSHHFVTVCNEGIYPDYYHIKLNLKSHHKKAKKEFNLLVSGKSCEKYEKDLTVYLSFNEPGFYAVFASTDIGYDEKASSDDSRVIDIS